MSSQVRIFGMHKAGTSFLMKALSHFCHRNEIALASAPVGFLPFQAYRSWGQEMSRDELDRFLSLDTSMQNKIRAFSGVDIDPDDPIGVRLDDFELFSIGDRSNERRVLFYRNSSKPVLELDESPAIRVIRNPLSIVKSAYFSHLRTHKTDGWSALENQRRKLERASRDEGMWLTYNFLREDLFFHMTEGPLRTLQSWPEDARVETVRLEDITVSPSSFLLKVWRMLGGDMSSLNFVPPELLTFEYQSGGRKQGEVDENDHLRSGDPDEWRDLLPDDLIERIRKDYQEIISEYYPSSMHDDVRSAQPRIAPKELLEELEQAYTAWLICTNQLATGKLAVNRAQDQLAVVLEQRDQIVRSLSDQLENTKKNRDKAIASYAAQLESMRKQRDHAIDSYSAQLTSMRDQRDRALAANKALTRSE